MVQEREPTGNGSRRERCAAARGRGHSLVHSRTQSFSFAVHMAVGVVPGESEDGIPLGPVSAIQQRNTAPPATQYCSVTHL